MRTYDIIETATSSVVGTQTCEDSFAPVLLAGREARLTHIDGEPVTDGAGFVALTPDPHMTQAEPIPYAPAPEGSGVTVTPITPAADHGATEERPDDAHPGAQIEAHGADTPAA